MFFRNYFINKYWFGYSSGCGVGSATRFWLTMHYSEVTLIDFTMLTLVDDSVKCLWFGSFVFVFPYLLFMNIFEPITSSRRSTQKYEVRSWLFVQISCGKPIGDKNDFDYCLPLIACCLSPVAYRLLSIATCQSPSAYRLSPIAFRQLHVVHCLSPIAYALSLVFYGLSPQACLLSALAHRLSRHNHFSWSVLIYCVCMKPD